MIPTFMRYNSSPSRSLWDIIENRLENRGLNKMKSVEIVDTWGQAKVLFFNFCKVFVLSFRTECITDWTQFLLYVFSLFRIIKDHFRQLYWDKFKRGLRPKTVLLFFSVNWLVLYLISFRNSFTLFYVNNAKRYIN